MAFASARIQRMLKPTDRTIAANRFVSLDENGQVCYPGDVKRERLALAGHAPPVVGISTGGGDAFTEVACLDGFNIGVLSAEAISAGSHVATTGDGRARNAIPGDCVLGIALYDAGDGHTVTINTTQLARPELGRVNLLPGGSSLTFAAPTKETANMGHEATPANGVHSGIGSPQDGQIAVNAGSNEVMRWVMYATPATIAQSRIFIDQGELPNRVRATLNNLPRNDKATLAFSLDSGSVRKFVATLSEAGFKVTPAD